MSDSTGSAAAFGTPRPSRRKRRAEGRATRKRVPLDALAAVPEQRGDALGLLAGQEPETGTGTEAPPPAGKP